MATSQPYRVPEKALVPIRFKNITGNIDLSAKTVEVYAVDPEGVLSPVKLGEGSGGVANAEFSIECDFGQVATIDKVYELQAAADVAQPNPITVCPNPKLADRVYVEVYAMGIF